MGLYIFSSAIHVSLHCNEIVREFNIYQINSELDEESIYYDSSVRGAICV